MLLARLNVFSRFIPCALTRNVAIIEQNLPLSAETRTRNRMEPKVAPQSTTSTLSLRALLSAALILLLSCALSRDRKSVV